MISSIPSSVLVGVIERLKIPVSSVQDFSFSSGGCINQGGKIKTSTGNYFLKWNDDKKFPGMFEAESKGLQLLYLQHVIRIPEVVGFGAKDSFQFLLLEFIDQKKLRSRNYWQQLGNRLAALHRCTAQTFGLNGDNYIGSLRQLNHPHSTWINFFIEQRLNVQVTYAIEAGRAPSDWSKKFESLYSKLPSLLPEEKPSLLHGDLWSGNILTDDKGEPCLIDPAVYYGNREVDLAMTRLFGGFETEFYASYENTFPLEPGYQTRVDLYNLYPLLVHVNLFGGSYVHSVESILRSYR